MVIAYKLANMNLTNWNNCLFIIHNEAMLPLHIGNHKNAQTKISETSKLRFNLSYCVAITLEYLSFAKTFSAICSYPYGHQSISSSPTFEFFFLEMTEIIPLSLIWAHYSSRYGLSIIRFIVKIHISLNSLKNTNFMYKY